MIEQIRGQVNEMCQNFSTNTRIEVSSNTRDLIAMVLSSIIEDPHRSWNIEANQLEFVVRSYVNAIPILLYHITRSENINDKITSFDFTHSFSRNLEPMMCVIPK